MVTEVRCTSCKSKIVQAYMTLWIIENLTLKVLIISILIFVPTIIANTFLISGRMMIHSSRISKNYKLFSLQLVCQIEAPKVVLASRPFSKSLNDFNETGIEFQCCLIIGISISIYAQCILY